MANNKTSPCQLKVLTFSPLRLKEAIVSQASQKKYMKLFEKLQKFPEKTQKLLMQHTEISDEGLAFFRIDRNDLDYTKFAKKEQNKRVLLIDIPKGEELSFTNTKTLGVQKQIVKQNFHLTAGEDVLAINIRNEEAAKMILDYATINGKVDPIRALKKAKVLKEINSFNEAADLYKLQKNIAISLYDFEESGHYTKNLTKFLAKIPGPAVIDLHSGGDQMLVRGAAIYIPHGKKPEKDDDPDTHFIENTDYKRDYANTVNTDDDLPAISFKDSSRLAEHVSSIFKYMAELRNLNNEITLGQKQADRARQYGGSTLT